MQSKWQTSSWWLKWRYSITWKVRLLIMWQFVFSEIDFCESFKTLTGMVGQNFRSLVHHKDINWYLFWDGWEMGKNGVKVFS